MDFILGTMMSEHPWDMIGHLLNKRPIRIIVKNFMVKMDLLQIQ